MMSLVIVSKIACQHIFVLSDPGMPRTFVKDCTSLKIRYNLLFFFFFFFLYFIVFICLL